MTQIDLSRFWVQGEDGPRLHRAPFDRAEILGRLRALESGGLTRLERFLLERIGPPAAAAVKPEESK